MTLEYVVNHVFLPPKLPQQDDHNLEEYRSLATKCSDAAVAYVKQVPRHKKSRWKPVLGMLAMISESPVPSEEDISNSITNMMNGDVMAFLIRAQNAGIIVRRGMDHTVFETFEVSAPCAAVMSTKGKLLWSFPGPAVQVSNHISDDPTFQAEFSSFLAQMAVDELDSAATAKKAGSLTVEKRDSAHPRYITQLLSEILRGMGQTAETTRIQKRIADDVLWNNTYLPWRRSPLWLVIRVALQTTLYRENDGHVEYKGFMVYFMSKLLRSAVEQQVSSDLLSCMRAKLSRRLYKIRSTVPNFVIQDVEDVVKETEELLKTRWNRVQDRQAFSARWDPQDLDFERDTRLSLHKSRAYISQILKGKSTAPASFKFQQTHHPRYYDFPPASLKKAPKKAFKVDPSIALADFEVTVQNEIDKWVSQNISSEAAVIQLETCIMNYSDAAHQFYAGNPEDMSIMFLTLFELWVAVDKLAVAQCPLLKEYSPEIPFKLLHVLIAHKSESVLRLNSIEAYLRRRHKDASYGSVFTDGAKDHTFAVRYFKQSKTLKDLRDRIEKEATAAREKTLDELKEKNAQHQSLQGQSGKMAHQQEYDSNSGKLIHPRKCAKCLLENKAKDMKITVHEWPLPRVEQEAMIVVFELDPPIVFGVWRTITFRLLHEICTPAENRPFVSAKHKGRLEDYIGLRKYAVRDNAGRITLASQTKSFYKSHYRTVCLPSESASVLLNNGLTVNLFFQDHPGSRGRWVGSQPFSNCDISDECTFRLPKDGPYSSLQYAVTSTSHTSNSVIASQSQCPKELNIHEYVAFATLRAGGRIQWLNIAREISARTLSFNREEVHLLILEAIWNIGPLSSTDSGNREWHQELKIPEFSLMLLSEMKKFLISVEANWLESVSASTIILITNVILKSCRDPQVSEKGYMLLRKARSVTFEWMRLLVAKLQEDNDEITIKDCRLRICEIAVICRGTYDVDSTHAPMLLRSADDVAIFMECAFMIHENTPPNVDGGPVQLKRLLHRDRRLSHALNSLLWQWISLDRSGLDGAISSIWTAYRPGSAWKRLPIPNERWITSQTATSLVQISQQIHLNTITGRLLVDGKSLGRLPQEITSKSLYARIFGQVVLDVIPSDMLGMEFSSRSSFSEHQVFFSLRTNDELVIRARSGTAVYEIIPQEKLAGDFPQLLVDDNVHWLDVSRGILEFRPLKRLWVPSENNWRINFSLENPQMKRNDSGCLIDIRSASFCTISAYIKALEDGKFVTITYSQEHIIRVELPRFRLSFFVNKDKFLESQNFPGMVIDDNQSAGTMYGLKNQLVLRPKEPSIKPRHVLIPHGSICFKDDGDHVRITIDTSAQHQVSYFDYTINVDLGCLVGNGSLISSYYKTYLHAITSFCLSDPLTGRTGTEEALYGINSANHRSFQKLGVEEVDLLKEIGSLTPVRTFYPVHLKVMHQVAWNILAPGVQHHGFHRAVQSIMEYANRLQFIRGEPEYEGYKSHSDPDLLERAVRRNDIFNTYEVACDSFSDPFDVVYTSRDQEVESDAVVANTSALVHNWQSDPPTICHQLFNVLHSWRILSGPDTKISLSYNRRWINPNLPEIWISLYNACRRSKKEEDLYRIAFTFSTMAYTSPDSTRDLIPTLLSFATVAKFDSVHPPRWSSYDLSNGTEPRKDQLVSLISSPVASFCKNEEELDFENWEVLASRRAPFTEEYIESQATKIAQMLIDQWPCREPNFQSELRNDIFDVSTLAEQVNPLFEGWYRNMELYYHIRNVQKLLDDLLKSSQSVVQAYSFLPSTSNLSKTVFRAIRLNQLFEHDAPLLSPLPNMMGLPDSGPLKTSKTSPGVEDMKSIIAGFRNSFTPFKRIYGEHMLRSFESLTTSQLQSFVLPDSRPQSVEGLVRYRDTCEKNSEEIFAQICNALGPSTQVETILHRAGLWPRITRMSLLICLSIATAIELPEKWKSVLSFFAQTLIQLQRSRRLLVFTLLGNDHDFFSELSNTGPVAQDTPDWLLIQLDNNFFVRSVQIDVTREMISPSSGQNAVLQLNMGEGKSSVIVPMVAASLAEGSNLVRVVVLKQLASQMFQLLVSRLSGLSSRQIYYLPFSRSLEIDAKKAQSIQEIFQECARTGGIMVVQPEHILSFKLMGIDRSLRSTSSTEVERGVVGKLIESQQWLDTYSRDILDESDEILQVRYQLIYTVGLQGPLEGHPDRWTTIQQCLSLVRKHVQIVRKSFPQGIEIMDRGIGSFPQVRVTQDDAASLLISFVCKDVISGKIANLPLDRVPKEIRTAASYFITHKDLSSSKIEKLEQHFGNTNPLWKGLLLLRGLFCHGILKYLLKGRRWRVDYGLDPSRSLLAVPYRAKDVPALRAEFGHPDVCIILTCFSYYYGGLTDDQLDQCIELLFKLDNPPLEYENWIHDISVPDVLRQVSGINIKDIGQRRQYLIPLFRYNHAVINFYLSQFVFPREAKQFPQKLTTSGWDIAERKSQISTGFSGTNDNRYLLPTSIAQLDDPQQESTNAKVLVHLLQPENDSYCRIPQGQRPSARGYLDLLINQDMDIRVLLDIGAQMVDLSNAEIAKEWLHSRPELSAVVLFGDNDELVVATTDGRVEPFISSPFNQQLEKCLVFLDDVHTRGTDLKLPPDFRAAVTLGPEVTKDRLVQGCMRMRKLGHGQSVMFMAPPEVDGKIRQSACKDQMDQVHVKDIIRWVMSETCRDILHHVPHWANQGLDHCRRKEAWDKVSRSASGQELASTWLQQEAKTLEEMYGLSSIDEKNFTKSVFKIPDLKRRCEDLGITHLQDVRMEEEHEREVSHEVEVERDIERPGKAEPADSSIHEDVRNFVRTGVLPHQSSAFVPLFSGAGESILGKTVWSPNLIATKDFSTTIINGSGKNAGDYLRPVHWIVSTSARQNGRNVNLVVFSPEEVNELLPDIRKSDLLHLHVYAPRVTQTMRSFEDLNFYAVPPLPRRWRAPEDTVLQTLNLWSGQLFLRDYETYLRICQFLGLYCPELLQAWQDNVTNQSDGFILKKDRPAGMYLSCALTESPIPALKEIIGLRRKGMSYLPTHIGRILQARSLGPEDFKS